MSRKLFMGGLSFSTLGKHLGGLFATAGSGEWAAVVTDRDTGGARGLDFVQMTSRW